MKKTLVILLSILMVVTIIAGCSKSPNDEASPSPSEGSGNSLDKQDGSNEKITGDIVVVSREDGSGTRGAFTELMGIVENGTDNTTIEATVANSTSVVIATVAGNLQSIGYISLGSLNDTVKALSIDGAEPTVENIKNNTYPVFRNFNIATKGQINEATEDFISFILSEEGQTIVEQENFISVENTGSYKGRVKEGKIVIGGSTSVAPVMEKLKEAYNKVNPNVEIEVHLGGSGTGMQQTMDGTLDIGMASRELKDEEKAVLDEIVIAIDGIAVIVNKENTIDNLTSQEVKDIFVGNTTSWDELD